MKLATSLIAFAIAVAPMFAHAAPSKPASPDKVENVGKPGKKVRHKKHAARHIEKPTLVKASATSKPHKRKKIEKGADKAGKKAAEAIEHGDAPEPGLKPASSHAAPKLTRASTSTKPALVPASAKEPAATPGTKRERRTDRARRRSAEKRSGAAAEDRPESEQDRLVAIIRGKIAMPTAPVAKAPPPCFKHAVEVTRGPEVDRFPLTTCDGNPAPLAVERLSVLARPAGAPKPTASPAALAKETGPTLAPGVHRVDARILSRVQSIVDHFTAEGKTARLSLVSGVRPTSSGSLHATGRALDFRLDGVKNEEIVKYCKTIDDTGCGYYPNSSFVHVDVRDLAAGHVSWIDASGPGESPRYVSTWPPPEGGAPRPENASLAPEIVSGSVDDSLSPLPEEGAKKGEEN